MTDHQPHKILVFDVETNGLLPKNNIYGHPIPMEKYPYILQLSYTIYDNEKKKNITTV